MTLDQILDRVECDKFEITIDAENLSSDQVDNVVAIANRKGLHVSGTRRWLLVRRLN